MWKMLRSLILLSLAVLALTGCGKKNCYEPAALQSFGSNADASDIYMDSTVPPEQQSQLKKDLALLGRVNLSENTEDSCTVGIKEFSGTSLVQYMKTRVRYLVGEKYDYKNPTVSKRDSKKTTVYASLGNRGVGHTYPVKPQQLSEVVTVMTNVGAYLYLISRPDSELITINVFGSDLSINSPRDGIIQVGEGLFTANKIPGSETGSMVNSLLRLAVMMHEARHSDGHGKHAAFPHEVCTSGTYKDHAACEIYSNGPYSVQATITKKFIEACTSCSTKDIDGMMRLQADYESRVLPNAESQDDRPEGFTR